MTDSFARNHSSASLPVPTRDTVKEYRETLTGLAEQLAHVKRMTCRYPVYLILSGRTYKFGNPDEVDNFIAALRDRLANFDASNNGVRVARVASL